ncbi:MAG: hypothetical protein AAFP69_07150, partial [Planctomycetota bacterium]
LGDEDQYSVCRFDAPQQVETAVNAIWRGNTLMTPLGGGVSIRPSLALRSENKNVDNSGETKENAAAAAPANLADGQWWWD